MTLAQQIQLLQSLDDISPGILAHLVPEQTQDVALADTSLSRQDDDGVLAEIYLLWKKFSAKIVILSFIKGKNKNILLFICYHLKEYE